jgi:lipid II:glycine glycyltransferase (peptidoglycan interpeptide bridge formation enzyme)
LRELLDVVEQHSSYAQYRSVEIRDLGERLTACTSEANDSKHFYLHSLSLTPTVEDLFRGLHKDCVQRKIHRAERESLRVESGTSEPLLRDFYRLMIQTRRRHGLPPQPLRWFRTLVSTMGDRMTLRVAYHATHAIAAIVTLEFRDTVTYKYGASDASAHSLGGPILLLWQAIERARFDGMKSFDLGRTDLDEPGLATFKERFGATRQQLSYYRWSRFSRRSGSILSPTNETVKRIVRALPDPLLVALGKLLYRHVA